MKSEDLDKLAYKYIGVHPPKPEEESKIWPIISRTDQHCFVAFKYGYEKAERKALDSFCKDCQNAIKCKGFAHCRENCSVDKLKEQYVWEDGSSCYIEELELESIEQ